MKPPSTRHTVLPVSAAKPVSVSSSQPLLSIISGSAGLDHHAVGAVALVELEDLEGGHAVGVPDHPGLHRGGGALDVAAGDRQVAVFLRHLLDRHVQAMLLEQPGLLGQRERWLARRPRGAWLAPCNERATPPDAANRVGPSGWARLGAQRGPGFLPPTLLVHAAVLKVAGCQTWKGRAQAGVHSAGRSSSERRIRASEPSRTSRVAASMSGAR